MFSLGNPKTVLKLFTFVKWSSPVILFPVYLTILLLILIVPVVIILNNIFFVHAVLVHQKEAPLGAATAQWVASRDPTHFPWDFSPRLRAWRAIATCTRPTRAAASRSVSRSASIRATEVEGRRTRKGVGKTAT